MPSTKNGGNIKFGIDFEANQASLNKLKKSLQDLQKIKLGDFKGSKEELQRIQKEALQVEKALNRAFNPTLKTTNISAFKTELEKSGITIKQLSTDMASLGPAGVKAFGLMSTEILTTNLQLKETNSLVDSMGRTMINTVKWGIASSIMNTFTQSVQGAFQYVQSLEKSLTNIRIVTGDSTESMAQFAEQANRSAQALGRSTLDYTKASLTFYQQGLNDEDVQARTEATLKAQNITGAGSQMADYLTSVWNGYKVANEEAELYVDKLAAVADSSASNMSQLAIAMSKVASTANTMGVDIDQLNAQIATVVATTRQAPESVGTAFKTIYTRMNDIKTGSDEAEISLGRYSGIMAELGFNVLDATGHLRDTGQVMEEIGGRWQTLTEEQRIYLAQTMGGQRQVNQLMALFDNWTTYSELLNTSLESEGTLTEKNARYMESLGAKMEQLGAAGERVKASLVTADMINPILTGLTGATNLLGTFIESIGGGTSALLGLASGMMAAFGPAISREINNVLVNIQNTRDNLVKMNEDVSRTQEMIQLGKDLRNNEGLKTNGQTNQVAISNILKEVTGRKEDIQQYYGIMQAGEVNAYNAIVKRIGEEQTQAEIYKIRIKNAEDLAQGIEDLKNKQDASTQSGKKMLDELSPDRIQGTLGTLAEELKIISEQTGVTGKEIAEKWSSLFTIDEYKGILELIPGIKELKAEVDAAGDDISKILKERIKASAEEAAKAIADLDGATLNGLKDKLKDIESELQRSQTEADNFVKKMQDLNAARTLTQMLQGTTQLMSGMSSLGGVIDNVFNKKMSAIQKFTKTIMGLGYAIPSIISGFNKLQTTLSPVIMHFTKQNILIQANNKLQEANNTLTKAKTALTQLQTKKNEGKAISDLAVAQAEREVARAEEQATVAQHALNAAMMANPVTWIVMGIVALTTALTVLPKIYDAVTMSVDQANQAIQNFNNAQKESTQKYAQAQEDIKILSGAEDEWNRLSKAAGDYNSTIDNLTEEEKERYYELSNLIANYNSAAVIGYDAQGNAIINKNANLKEQIQLINQAAQAEKRRFYNSDEYYDNIKGQKTLEEDAKKTYQASNQALSLQKTGYANTLRSSMSAILSELIKDNGDSQRIDEYNKLLQSNEEDLIKNEEHIFQMLIEDENSLREKYGKQIDFNIVNEARQASQNYKNKVSEVKIDEKEMQKASQLNYTTLFDQLSLNSDAYNQLRELGVTNVEGLITSYVEGAGQAFSRANLGADTYKTATQKLNQDLLEPFIDSFNQIQQNGETINLNDLINKFAIGETINDDDLIASSLAEKQQKTQKLLEQFFAENQDFISNIAEAVSNNPQLEKIWEEYFANLLNLENIDIDFNNQKVNEITSSALERLQNNVNNAILNSNIGGKTPINIGEFLHADYSESELDAITDKFVEIYDGTRPVQTVLSEIENTIHDISVASSGVQALNLLNKDSLTDEELGILKSSLQDLIQEYPQLTKEITILNTQWLKGTSAYENALTTLTNTVIGAYGDLVSAGEISQKEAYDSIEGFITNTENLQHAQNEGIAVGIDYHNKLGEIGSQYASCKDELERYVQAINTKTQTQIKAAQFDMELATRSAENSQLYGLQAERVESLAEQYVRYAEQGRAGYEGLNENAELAADAATRYIRLNDAVADLGKNYEELAKMAQQVSEGGLEEALAEHDDLFRTVKEDVADIVDTSEELLGDDWIVDHMNQILEAAQGNESAIESLRESAQDEIITNLGINFDGFEEGKERFLNDLNQLEDGADIMATMDLDDIAFLQKLVLAMQQAGMSQAEIESALSGIGIDVDLAPYEEGLNQAVDDAMNAGLLASDAFASNAGVDAKTKSETEQTTDNVEYAGHTVDVSPVYGSQVTFPIQATTIPGSPIPAISSGPAQVVHPSFPQVTVTPTPVSTEVSKETTSTALEVIGARKSSGGHLSHTNKSGGNKKAGKGGGGKGGKGGKGGGGKAKEPNKAKGATNKADRYRNNTVKANKLANQMTKLNKQQERLTGKDSLKNLQKQLAVLEKQKDVIRERLGLQRDEQNELANNLKKYGATFDKDGTLNNYFTTHDKILKEYNDKVAEWNQMTAEQQESNKDYLSNAKEIMDQAFKDLERYDKLQQEIAKTQQEQIDKTQEQINLKVKQLDLKIKAELDLSEAKRDWNKFQKDIVKEIRDDDILGLNRFRFADIASYYNNAGTGSIQNLTDRLKEVMGDQNGIFSGSYFTQQLAKMSITDRAAQLEKVKEIFNDLQDQMKGFKEIADEIKKSIFNAIDAAQDAFDEQMNEYKYLGDLIDHNMKITKMFFGDEAYDQMAKFYDRIEENNNAQLNFLAKQKDLWYSRMAEEQARMNQLAQTQGTDSNLYKEARDRFEKYKKHWMDTVKDLNSTVEDALDNIMDKYNNAINGILANFELKLGDGHTLDDIEDEWDILNDQADRYFDKINAAYEIDKLENAFNDAINDNDGDIAAQQSLNDLMEQQLAYLRDKERLTQYDVDRANTLLQIEMKRLALEQSRSNKNRLRLRRDSQGNYTYQYTADTEAISKAEQELADAQNSLYNSDKAAYVDNLSNIQKSAENIKNKLKDIWTDTTLSDEQRLQKTYELEKYYGDQINKLLEDNANIRNNLIQSSSEQLAKIYGINIEQFQALTDEEQTNILKDLIPQAGSYLSSMVEGLIGQGGVGKLFEDSINRFLQAEDERINSIAEIEKNGQISFEDIINDTNTVIGQAEQLLDNNEALINSYEQELNAVQNTINGVNELIQTYERAKQVAIQAATAAHDLLISNDAETTGSSLAQEQAAQNANDNVFNTWTSRNNSYGDLSNFTPYSPNWHSSDYAAIFGSSNVSLADLAAYQHARQGAIEAATAANNILTSQNGYTPINVNSILDTIQSNVSHINDILEALHTESSNYYTNALNKAKDIERAIIANQTVHIDADFPNARDVSNIIDAINNLTLVAAQKAGKI